MDKIAKYGRLLHENKLVIGAGGNISQRDGQALIIKKKGADMSRGSIDDFIALPFSEAAKSADVLSSETPFHIACYEVRPDIQAIMHVHSPFVVAAAKKTDILGSQSYEFDCILEKDVPVIEYIKPGSQDLASAIADEVRNGANAVILRQHGAIALGKDLEEAYLRILALERACVTFLHT